MVSLSISKVKNKFLTDKLKQNILFLHLLNCIVFLVFYTYMFHKEINEKNSYFYLLNFLLSY